ncbi:MAG TPA: hypothetical protein VFI12_03330 [Thermomicrobiales bacterium]|jgi:hypothetical protein|nr:hypothetical protein [Thermomicrobiales bacterium]
MHATNATWSLRNIASGALIALTLATGCLIGAVESASAQPPTLREERGHSPHAVAAATQDPDPAYHHARIGFLP